LDNTLWDGSVYYSDKESVKLKLGTKEALKELSKRGIFGYKLTPFSTFLSLYFIGVEVI